MKIAKLNIYSVVSWPFTYPPKTPNLTRRKNIDIVENNKIKLCFIPALTDPSPICPATRPPVID